jgi:predicted NBD/HSP70 family sugar kinase
MYIGIDIGGTHTRVALGQGEILQEKVDFPTEDFPTSLQKIKEALENLGKKSEIQGIGVSVVGPIDLSNQKLLKPAHLTAWQGIAIKDELERAFGRTVVIKHDAAVAGLAEWKYGAGKDKNPVLYYTVSTGVGVGLIVNGKIFEGTHNIEAGHQIVQRGGPACTCGQNGDLDVFASGEGILKRTGKSSKEIEGTDIWGQLIDWVAVGVTNSILHYCPQIVVMGGAQTNNQDLFFPPLRESIKKYLHAIPIPEIVPSKFRADSGLIGALILAEEKSDK